MLELQNITVRFGGPGASPAVDDVSLTLGEREKVAIIGETGSGKSVLLLAVLQMLPSVAAVTGKALLEGTDLLSLPQREMNRIRGARIAYVPQGSGNGMNPLLRVGYQVGEPLMIHQGLSPKAAIRKAVEVLRRFDFGEEEKLARQYPHTLSGGMRQRAMIAMGVAQGAPILFADEPTKGLDSRRIAMVAEAFHRLEEQAILCVTHDLRFAREIAQRVAVIYASQQVEQAGREEFFREPLHPYSQAMLAALPENGLRADLGFAPPREDKELAGACHYYRRCPWKCERCRVNPPLFDLGGGRKVRCWKYGA